MSPGPGINLARASALATIGLFALAILYTFYLAQAVLMPIVVATLLAMLLAPVVRTLARLHISPPLGSVIVVVALVGFVVGGIGLLADPAAKWTAELPKITKQLERKFRLLKEPIEDMRQASQQVEAMTTFESPQQVPQRVVVEEGGLFVRTVSVLQLVGSTLGILFALLFFFLATGELFRDKLRQVMPGGRGEQTINIARDVQRKLSAYLATVTLINAGLGLATGFALWLLDMPNAILWGTMAAVLNFVPLVGAVIGVGIVALVGLLSFPGVVDGMLPAIIYLALHLVESQFVTPVIVGRRLTMNPVAVFISIVAWTWMWGIPGALMAVPLLAAMKVVCDAIVGLRPVGVFIGGRST
ncbi:MAG: AI-2E family transporter [Rhodospirillales bacterium]|nr:AI-2E family transporter [Rhodospirillales bacterium]